MRKIFILSIFIIFVFDSFLLAAVKELPPVPSIEFKQKKRQALKDCKVPPQLAILPPQIDADYRTCVNGYYEPDPVNVKALIKQVAGDDGKLISLSPAQGYVRAYEIVYESLEESKSFFSFGEKKKVKEILICDDSLSNCYKAEKLINRKNK